MTTLESIFHIDKGHQLALNRVRLVSDPRAGIAYVTRSHRNNGIGAWVRPIAGLDPAPAGNISVCLRSRNHTMAAFVQPRPFYTTYHVAVLTPKRPMSLQEKLWWCLCIRANRFRFNFGRQANRTIQSLELPNSVPSWASDFQLTTYSGSGSASAEMIDVSEWAEFPVPELFSLHFGQHVTLRNLGHGNTPLVTASMWNNGITAKVGVAPDWPGGQITVANNGTAFPAFFQPHPFAASRDVTVLVPKTQLSSGAALFVCTVLRQESVKYSYARKWTAGRMQNTVLRLPSKGGTPDYEAMERFMKSLPLGWVLETAEAAKAA